MDSQCSSSMTWSRPKFLRGLKGSKENTRSLTLSGLWLDLCFRSMTTISSCFFFLIYGILQAEGTYISDLCFLQQYPFDIPTEAFSFEIFKQAFAAVQSCVVHLQVIFHFFWVFPSLYTVILIIWS